MFFARPAIEPLRWNLTTLPVPHGSRNFVAVTMDGRPIDLRFSSGWLTVERGEPGASPDDPMEEILSQPISPFGIVDIFAEQLCDMLGLMVCGQRVDAPAGRTMFTFDWSGRTTYWCSTHSMMLKDDAEVLTDAICEAVADVVLLQPVWQWQPPRVRCRQIRFLIASDDRAILAIGCEARSLQRLLTADDVSPEEFDRALQTRIELSRQDHGEDLTGGGHLRSRAGVPALNFSTIQHRLYRFWAEYETDDASARARVTRALHVLEQRMCRGFEVVDLETGAVLSHDTEDEEDTRSYSVALRDWCLERPERFLSVTVQHDDTRERYVGYRPLAKKDGLV